MNKKGQGLTLNTIIVAILVILVLVVLVAFFLGGSSGLTKTIKSVFFGTTAGTDEAVAIQTCRQRCEQIDSLVAGIDKDNARYQEKIRNSAFCSRSFEIDRDGDGAADTTSDGETPLRFYCTETGQGESLNVPCTHRCQ